MEVNIDLNKKQSLCFDYIEDLKTTEILYGGAAGGGKSFLGCLWIISSCIKYPDTRWLIGRSKLKALKQTTLATFFDVLKILGLKQEHYNYNAQSSEIRFYNNSLVLLKDLFTYPSDPNFDSLGSLEVSGAFIDEVNQISEKAKNIVSSRIRYKLEEYNLTPKLLMTCNPSRNWVYSEFYKKDKENKLEEHKKFIKALVTDNKDISPHYIEQLKKLDLISKKRLLYGEWEYENEDTLMSYDDIINMFENIQPVEGSYYLSVDVARLGKDKTIILLWKGLHIINIYELDISKVNETVDLINKIREEYKIIKKNIIIDSDGVGGGVADYLKGSYNFINNGKPLNGENYQNLKTQCYFKLAELISDIKIHNCSVEQKESIIEELSILKRVNIDNDGKVKINSKDDIKQEIGRSPDYSDTMMMRMVLELKPLVKKYKIY